MKNAFRLLMLVLLVLSMVVVFFNVVVWAQDIMLMPTDHVHWTWKMNLDLGRDLDKTLIFETDFEDGIPDEILVVENADADVEVTLTTDDEYVISGKQSLLLKSFPGGAVWRGYLSTNPEILQFDETKRYQIRFDARIISWATRPIGEPAIWTLAGLGGAFQFSPFPPKRVVYTISVLTPADHDEWSEEFVIVGSGDGAMVIDNLQIYEINE